MGRKERKPPKPNRAQTANNWDVPAQRVLALLSTSPNQNPKPFWVRLSNYNDLLPLTSESVDRNVTIRTRVSRAARTLRESAERMLASIYGNAKDRTKAHSELRQHIHIECELNEALGEWAIRVKRRNNPSLSLLPD